MALVHEVLRQAPGVLVDVGAHLGTSMRPFVADGWQVYAFEPEPTIRQQLLADPMTASPMVTVDPRAVSERDGETVTLFTSPVSSGISTLSPFHPSHRAGPSVQTVRLDTYLADVDAVTVLKTDVEGYDLPVLRTFPWDRLQPRAVVCEFEDRKTLPLGYGYPDLVTFLLERGYAVMTSEWYPIVEYGRIHRWRSLRQAPVALADPGAWGNLIAVDLSLIGPLRRAARLATIRLRARIAIRRIAGQW